MAEYRLAGLNVDRDGQAKLWIQVGERQKLAPITLDEDALLRLVGECVEAVAHLRRDRRAVTAVRSQLREES